MSASDAQPGGARYDGLYAVFWRWHFYAGLLVMPVLMLMAVTGALYLFKDEINDVLYRRLLEVTPSAASTSPQAWADAAATAAPGRVAEVVPPAVAGQSAKVVVETQEGGRRAVYIDPQNAAVLGSIPDGGAMQIVRRIHSLDIAGPAFRAVVEVVASWAIIMVATGIVLWWPRGQTGGVITIRGRLGGRLFWRDLHAVTGALVGLVIVFLAVTGMPWSVFWGHEVRTLTTQAGWGRPNLPTGTEVHNHSGHAAAVPWALQDTDIQGEEMSGMQMPLTLDGAVKQVNATGLPRPYTLSIPADSHQAWSAAYMPGPATEMRTVYLDAGDGHVIADLGYGQFGPAAKAIEWGIAVHQGQAYGLINKLLMLTGCIAIWVLGISSLLMWWQRRPPGRLAAPPRPLDRRAYLPLAAVVMPLAIIYPLAGASLVGVVILDYGIRRITAAWISA